MSPNPVDLKRISEGMDAPKARMGPGPHLLTVGRLSEEKGFDLLLHALVRVRERFPGVDLIVAGEGLEKAPLKALCRRLYLETAVSFVGHVERVHAFFPGTTLFVLPSRFEGMPNSLLEASAAGLPVVATPAFGGDCGSVARTARRMAGARVTAGALAEPVIAALESIRPGRQVSFVDLSRRWMIRAGNDRTAIPKRSSSMDDKLKAGMAAIQGMCA